jgi:dTDP-4-dehydrorhamnose reductase
MKILIIGHKGNLGQKLIKVFKKHDPVGMDKEELDITKEIQVLETVKEVKPQIIINASAYNAVDACEEDEAQEKLANEINGYGPGYLAKAAKAIDAILVHYSTDYVFSGDKKEGYLEEAKTGPIQNYGKSKLLGEEEVKKQGEKYYLIRTSKLFGKPGISDMIKKSFIDIMLDLSKQRDELDVVDEEYSCFTYTPDLAGHTKKLIEGKEDFGIYHFVNEGALTWFECAKKIFEKVGKKIKLNPVSGDKFPRPAQRPKFSKLINSKFQKLRSFDQALEDYLF